MMRKRSSDPLGHREAMELLPWHVNGTLGESESKSVQSHLGSCLTCRRELEFLRQLERGVVESEDVDLAPRRNFDALMRRVNETGAPASVGQGLRWRLAAAFRALSETDPVIRTALAAQAALLVLLAFWLVLRPVAIDQAPRFDTLTTGVAESADLRVVFSRDATVGEITELLSDLNVVITRGPTPTGVFSLAVEENPQASLDQALARLRASERVQFAERVYDER